MPLNMLLSEKEHKEEQIRSQMAEVEAREVALKGKFDQCVDLS